ncbi:MAG: ATP-binding protein [Candidatus Neomarinimicrobiota bacterium]
MSFSGKEFKLHPRTAVSVFIILLFLLLSSAYLEFRNRKNTTLELMALMSENLSQTIRQAAVNSILSNDVIEDELAARTQNALQIITSGTDLLTTSQAVLERIIAEHQLIGMQIINREGQILRTIGRITDDHIDPVYLQDWLRSDESAINFGMSTTSAENKFVIGIGLKIAAGAVIGFSDADELIALRRKIGIGNLMNSISQNSAVAYIAIQDSLGILAATANIETLSAIASDSFLRTGMDSTNFKWRISRFKERRIFEGVLPFYVLDVSYGLIRIGLDYKPIQEIQASAIRQGAMRLGILLVIGFLLAAFSITNQNVRLLRREKENITKEVYRLQDDLRRRERFSAMGELAAGVAHEIRNPLNAISMTVQRLAREFPPAEGAGEQAQLIKTIRQEIERIGAIIRQFLDFARPAPLAKKSVEIDELITNVIALYQARAASQQIKIESENHLHSKVFIDPDKITQGLINLLENALDAVASGGTVKLRVASSGRKKFSITVEDDGMGIPTENLNRIFNLYFTTKPNGTGLGLAQVYQIVSEHSGEIEVISRPGQGTRFVLTIPIMRE